ncbi:MAG: hypothetical protein Q7S40_02550 [Opitutaceae bacterium]|nr:hypothetical protein [Opitutaceae bacterium]
MRTNTRNTSGKSAINSKTLKPGNGSKLAVAGKLRKKWRFAPDAIGMVDGPRDLSRRKGLSG